jgi:hypothetical protein
MSASGDIAAADKTTRLFAGAIASHMELSGEQLRELMDLLATPDFAGAIKARIPQGLTKAGTKALEDFGCPLEGARVPCAALIDEGKSSEHQCKGYAKDDTRYCARHQNYEAKRDAKAAVKAATSCKSLTINNTPCSRKAAAGGDYCAIHIANPRLETVAKEEIAKCGAATKTNGACTRNGKEEYGGRCAQHIGKPKA